MTAVEQLRMLVEEARGELVARRTLAEAATPGPWEAKPPHGWDSWDEWLIYAKAIEITPGGGEHGDNGLLPIDANHIAANDPQTVLAGIAVMEALCAETLAAIERHAVIPLPRRFHRHCVCGAWTWPCPDLTAYFTIWGVTYE